MALKRFFRLLSHEKNDGGISAFCHKTMGFTPQSVEVYRAALTHKSSMLEAPDGHKVNNERLEYLGDAMLSAVVAEFLYLKYPVDGEGYLTELRSKIVSRRSLNAVACKMGLCDILCYNRSAIHPSESRSLGGNALEALIGAIYIDRGYAFTRKIVIEKIIKRYLDIDALAVADWNHKGMLIDYCQKRHRKVSFVLDRTERHKHGGHIVYYVHIDIDGQSMASASGLSIKSAEQAAAEKTYKLLHIQSR